MESTYDSLIWEREKERDREREGDRKRERDRERKKARKIEREIERERECIESRKSIRVRPFQNVNKSVIYLTN